MSDTLWSCRVWTVTTAMLALLVLSLVFAIPALANQTGWQSLKNGTAFVMMRHALAPGTGDPQNFKINDCQTQRNLSDKGRQQARETGELFRANGIDNAEVWSSAWCRCQQTARLLALDKVEILQPLNSFFRQPQTRQKQTNALKDWLHARTRDLPLVLVTHQVNISALTGTYARSGELIFVELTKNSSFEIVDRALIEQ